ncbi:carbohydrate ABC transporter permease [Halocatena marina]|uniref:Carbohydrate ABC transporter permease n=2 Tax=Halocatena marina TaxID=2934937 RepID=A0ABD5YUV9_9EURY
MRRRGTNMARSNTNYPGYDTGGASYWVKRSLIYIVVLAGALWMVLPIWWVITTSLSEAPVASDIVFYPRNFTLDNFLKLWELRDRIPIFNWFFNSVVVGLAVTGFNLIFDSLAGYSLAKIEFIGRDKIFLLFIATMMIPGMITLIPMYLLIAEFGLLNTHAGLMLPFIAKPFGIFVFRQYFKGLPSSLGDAALIDGCNKLQVFYKIYLPMAKPAVASVGIIVFMGFWNNFTWPFILMSDTEMYTLPAALYTAQTNYFTDWGMLMAITLILVLPLLLLFIALQKYFIRGMTMTGVKGCPIPFAQMS